MKLTIALAARKRPHLLIPTIEKTLANVSLPDTRIMVALDSDDAETVALKRDYEQVVWSVEDREDSVGAKFNRAPRVCPADVYMVHVDHAHVVTRGFDEIILEAAARYPDRLAVIRGYYANLSFPSLQAVTKEIVEVMGGIYPEHFPYWFIDHWLDDIMRMVGREVFAAVVVDYWTRRNHAWGGTLEKREVPLWATYYDALAVEREAIARRILDRMDEPQYRKDAMIANFPIVHQRSMAINDICRRDNGQGAPFDARYVRVRNKALDYLRKAAA